MNNLKLSYCTDLVKYNEMGNMVCECPHKDNCPNCDICKNCNKTYEINNILYYERKRDNKELCTKLNWDMGLQYPSVEVKVRSWLEEWCLTYYAYDTQTVEGMVLDLYIPEKKIAIEYCPVYWKSDMFCHHDYHYNKFKKLQSKGIMLIQIWEDWLLEKAYIVKSFLKAKLGLISNGIYARNCIIKEVDNKLAKEFVDKNHIQGNAGSAVKLGLFTKDTDELVSFMSFAKPRINLNQKKGESQWEVVRFCNKLNTHVVGGPSKLFKYFCETYNPESILSFSSNDISQGRMYQVLGFEYIGETCPSYWYIHPTQLTERCHRTKFTRKAIAKRWNLDHSDKSWTEKTWMDQMGFFRIFDSGQTKWIWRKKQK